METAQYKFAIYYYYYYYKVADDALVRTICECVLNVLKGTVPVSKPTKKKLLVHKKPLIALAEKSTPLEKKKKLLVQYGKIF